MNHRSPLQEITDVLLPSLLQEDPDADVQVQRTSLGWIKLCVTTSRFQGQSQDEREQYIDSLLENIEMSLESYPFSRYNLYTPEEAASIPAPRLLQLPLWSEILMEPEPDQPVLPDEDTDTSTRPYIVTFYSFKGGVGRTTALGIVARMLASEGYRVVMIDFDLEAPGLSFLFPSAYPEQVTYGVLDYLHQRYLTPDQNVPTISECVRQIDIPRSELYLVPAGEYDEGYVHRLADIDVRLFYNRDNNPITQFIDDIATYVNRPDVILIDARPGFTDVGAVALLDLADLGYICFSPTEQNLAGLQWVIQAVRKQYQYRGKPDVRFLLTPIPPIKELQPTWIGKTENWISETWGIPKDLSVGELHTDILYNPAIQTLGSFVEEIPPEILVVYQPMTETISASLPAITSVYYSTGISREDYVAILQELTFRSATAQEMNVEEIPEIFQKTGDFPKFLDDRTWLVRGAKGTGKSLLFRLFVERPDDAMVIASSVANLQKVSFIPAHGRQEIRPTLLSSIDMESYQRQIGDEQANWKIFWGLYALLQLCATLSELHPLQHDDEMVNLCQTDEPRHTDIITWLIKQSHEPLAASQVGDSLRAVDRWLTEQGKKVWLIYDELDSGFQEENLRCQSLEALFAWWMESGFMRIVPKILLREDIWKNLNFTNKTHFAGRSVVLQWDEEDLWRLVLRQALQSPTLAQMVEQKYAVTINALDKIEHKRLKESLDPLWGERMGRGKKAYASHWVRNRITDGNNNRFPRSMIVLLQQAVERERTYAERETYESILRPRALTESLPFVSEQRVDEVRNEYPELANYLDTLKGERSPIEKNRLEELWEKSDAELKNVIEEMKQAGILQEYTKGAPSDAPRYAVAELYLLGLGMTRQGQR